MSVPVLLVVGVAFTAFAAMVFSVLTLILGKMFKSFESLRP